MTTTTTTWYIVTGSIVTLSASFSAVSCVRASALCDITDATELTVTALEYQALRVTGLSLCVPTAVLTLGEDD